MCISPLNDDETELNTQNINLLINKPFRTADPHYMWTTTHQNLPLRLRLTCACVDNAGEPENKSEFCIRIWNYNDPTRLRAGAKACTLRLIMNGISLVLFDGVLEKGCGPKLIEYSAAICFTIIREPVEDESCTQGVTETDDLSISSVNTVSVPLEEMPQNSLPTSTGLDKIAACGLSVSNNSNTEGNANYRSSVAQFNEGYFTSKMEEGAGDYPNLRRCDTNLEKSWSSLNFFDHFHAGRINSCMKQTETARYEINPMMVNSQMKCMPQLFQNQCSLRCDHPLEGCVKKTVSSRLFLQPTSALMESSDDVVGTETKPSLTMRIPELPKGNILLMNILTTWGDFHYVGLTGVEIFTEDGLNVAPYCTVTADPADINVLPEYTDDPRVVGNLIDGFNKTRDDVHMWLTPFTAGHSHLVQFVLPSWSRAIALIRIWNYNKSRVHTSRGVRHLTLYLDGAAIFHGEISRASGLETGEPEDFSESILFTTNDAILECIAANDDTFISMNSGTLCPHEQLKHLPQNLKPSDSSSDTWIDLRLLSSWDTEGHMVGLTGIEFLGSNEESLPVERCLLVSQPNTVQTDLLKLFDGINETTDRHHMWLSIHTHASPATIRCYFKQPATSSGFSITAIRIWNYNDSTSERYYGVKKMEIVLGGGMTCYQQFQKATIILRPAPKHTKYPFSQTIYFTMNIFQRDCLSEGGDAEATTSINQPIGFVWQFQLHSNWLDERYIGLDKIELLNSSGIPIVLSKCSVFTSGQASPHIAEPVKTSQSFTLNKYMIENLLLPLSSCTTVYVFLVFDQAVSVGAIRLVNSSKVTQRGVRDFTILVDEVVVCSGQVPRFEYFPVNSLFNTAVRSNSNFTIVFNENVVNALEVDEGRVLRISEAGSGTRPKKTLSALEKWLEGKPMKVNRLSARDTFAPLSSRTAQSVDSR